MNTPHAHRHYVIIGGTAGMGWATACALADKDVSIALVGRDEQRTGRRSAELAAATGAHVTAVCAQGDIGSVVEGIARDMGRIDGLAVTAGPMAAAGQLHELSDDDWQESFETQVMTAVRATRAVLPVMREAGAGSIVLVAALSARLAKSFLPHYGAMKAAIAALSKNIARTYGADGIRCNCIAPGAIDTEALASVRSEALRLYPQMSPDDALNHYARTEWKLDSALGRVGKPSEVGEVIAFLLGPQASYLTGAIVNIDGGSDF